MRWILFIIGFWLVQAASVGALASEADFPDALAKQVRSLIAQLDDTRFCTRELAERSLRQFGPQVMKYIKQEIPTASLEARKRLERIAKDLCRLDWLNDLQTARARAWKEGKLILVFSTVGDIDGFG